MTTLSCSMSLDLRSIADCKPINSWLSAPKALSSRMAILEDNFARPLRKFDRAGRPTPSSLADSVTVSPPGDDVVSNVLTDVLYMFWVRLARHRLPLCYIGVVCSVARYITVVK